MELGKATEYLISIALGVKYRSNYAFADKLGAIADHILYRKDSFFNEEFFPRVQAEVEGRILFNPRTNNNLRLGPQSIILEVHSEKLGNTALLNDAVREFKNQIINDVIQEHKITQIGLIGYINRYLIRDKELAEQFIDTTMSNTMKNVNDIDFKFSKRIPIEESFAKKHVNDYYNVLFNLIKRSSLDELFVSIDFQRCFDPLLDNIAQFRFDPFNAKVEDYNGRIFPDWLGNYSKAV